jgi:peptidoglycan/LPS O-acetylase OafA/YrhL
MARWNLYSVWSDPDIRSLLLHAIFSIALATRRNIYFTVVPVLLACAVASNFTPADRPAWSMYFNPIVLEFVRHDCGRSDLHHPSRSLALPVSMACLCAGWLLLAPENTTEIRWLTLGIPSALLVWAIASSERLFHDRTPTALLFLGGASYAIYLFHPMFSPSAPLSLASWGTSMAVAK